MVSQDKKDAYTNLDNAFMLTCQNILIDVVQS